MIGKYFIILLGVTVAALVNGKKYPVVMWHGMGDTCCLPFSLGSIKKLLEQELNHPYVKSLQIGGNFVLDYESGFFIHPNEQVEYVCKELAKDENLKNGYNAIGFSQGGQFLRALAQRCPNPPMKVLISMGGQHQGVFGLPKCPSLSSTTCEYVRRLLNLAAYEVWVQMELVQATYWHNPMKEIEYQAHSTFLADINNEVFVNGLYANNLNNLDKFVMVKFLNDTIVQPKESQWFEFYKPGQDKEILPLNKSKVYEQVWFQNRRAKWRKQARLQLLQDAWRMRCLSLGQPPVMGQGGGQLPNGAVLNGPLPPGMSVDQAPENLSNSNASKENPHVTMNDASGQQTNINMMHSAESGHNKSAGGGQNNGGGGGEKTYTELKLYKDHHMQHQHLTQALHAQMQHDPRLMAALDHNSDDGSDGSDSEEIDLTSGSCIDFSNKHQTVVMGSTPTPNSPSMQQQQQQQQQQLHQSQLVASNGVH